MDPLTHTLVGANLAVCLRARRVPMATPALVLGANLPDLDVLSFFTGSDFALGFRRGWTHGWPALIVLPIILWLSLLIWDRARARGRSDARPEVSNPWLLASCYLATLTHPCLDWLNTYGMRWLMPLDGSWFYGDSVFIVDPWLWALLGGAWLLRRRSRGRRLAAAALAAGFLWVVSLVGLHGSSAARARGALAARDIAPVEELMVGPRPANPLAWDVVARSEGRLHLGRLRWPGGELALDLELADARADPRWPAVESAARQQAPGFLSWVRFPWLELEEAESGELDAYVMDARYVRRRTTGFGGERIRLPAPRSSPRPRR